MSNVIYVNPDRTEIAIGPKDNTWQTDSFDRANARLTLFNARYNYENNDCKYNKEQLAKAEKEWKKYV